MYSHLFKMYFSNLHYSFRHPVVRNGGIAFLFSLLVLVLISVLIWNPSMVKYNEAEQNLHELRDKLVMLNQLYELTHTYNRMQTTLNHVDKKLKSTTSLAEFTSTLNILANKNNVKIVSKTTRDSQFKNGYNILYQELALQGSYRSIRQFISSLRDMPSWTLVMDAQLKMKKGQNDLSGDFVLVSYTKQSTL